MRQGTKVIGIQDRQSDRAKPLMAGRAEGMRGLTAVWSMTALGPRIDGSWTGGGRKEGTGGTGGAEAWRPKGDVYKPVSDFFNEKSRSDTTGTQHETEKGGLEKEWVTKKK
jgi:hypothetical protein